MPGANKKGHIDRTRENAVTLQDVAGQSVFHFTSPITNKVTELGEKRTRQRAKTQSDKDFEKRADREAWRVIGATPQEINFRHSGWLSTRLRVREAMWRACLPEARRDRFDNCGADCIVEWSPSRKCHRVRGNFCGDRFCVPCCRARAAQARRKLLKLVQGQQPLFVTLTMKASPRPLSETIDRLIACFARLRRNNVWREAVHSGAFVIEIKKGAGSGQWHPHIHCLCLGRYIPQRELSYVWKRITTDSQVVDIQRVSDSERAVGYVGKYLTKGWTPEVASDSDALLECILALRGRRLLATFGGWRRVDVELDDHGEEDWTRIGRLANVIDAANRGERWAQGVCLSLTLFSSRELNVSPKDETQ